MLGTNSLPLLLNPLHFHTKFYILEGYNEYLYINILSSCKLHEWKETG